MPSRLGEGKKRERGEDEVMFERKTQTSVTQKDREGDYANVHGCARAAYGMDGTRVCVDMESKRAQKTVGHGGGRLEQQRCGTRLPVYLELNEERMWVAHRRQQ